MTSVAGRRDHGGHGRGRDEPARGRRGRPGRQSTDGSEAAQIVDLVRQSIEADSLKAVIVKVTTGDKVVLRGAFGESITDVPATTGDALPQRGGGFRVPRQLLLQFVDEGRVTLDDTIDRGCPDLPKADDVTLKMLANQTTGYPDYETDAGRSSTRFNADPFHILRPRGAARHRVLAGRCSSRPGRTGATPTPTS